MTDWQQATMKYMQDNIEDSRDPVTGEVNVTRLAEDLLYNGPLDDKMDSPEYITSEIAFAVVERDAGRMTEAEAKKWIEDYT